MLRPPTKLQRSDMDAVAAVHRASFDDRLPWLAGLHTPEEDRAYFGSVVFDECELWGTFHGPALAGFIAFRDGWIDQLYVLPAYQGRGLGSALLEIARDRYRELNLWTFQRNAIARRFYERQGFVAVELTDGSRNEEREPDIRYVWHRR
ncbi:GNAT family N-acetyltransferase [Bosea sp. LjRoot90]|uniref:GNAT family N-acetyltransferase n=1 Tax=Bosea sp. LjRoot90 TaxID=3342342 RepID=UPI003ED0E3FB